MKILNSKGYTLLILNGDHTNPDALSRDNFNRFWTQSMYRVAVDGGLNVLNEFDKGSPSVFIPHTVIGDLDSADEDLIEEYGHYGVEIINRENQAGRLKLNFLIKMFILLILLFVQFILLILVTF